LIKAGWILVAIILIALRLMGIMDNRFQAIAHLCVGGWFAAWAVQKRFKYAVEKLNISLQPEIYGYLFLVTSAVELFAFLTGIGKIDGQ
jgi:hypothetical protein